MEAATQASDAVRSSVPHSLSSSRALNVLLFCLSGGGAGGMGMSMEELEAKLRAMQAEHERLMLQLAESEAERRRLAEEAANTRDELRAAREAAEAARKKMEDALSEVCQKCFACRALFVCIVADCVHVGGANAPTRVATGGGQREDEIVFATEWL